MKILYITFGLPAPPSSGARVRDGNLIRRIARHHDVHVLSVLEPGQSLEHARGWLDDCRHIDGVAGERGFAATLRVAVDAVLSGRPLATTPYYYPELADKIRSLSRQEDFDLVQIEHTFLAPYLAAMDPGFRGGRVISLHNIGLFQYASMARSARGGERPMAMLKAWLMRRWETAAIQEFDHAIVVSREDLANLRAIDCSIPATVVPNGVDTRALQALPPAEGEELVFVGTMGYFPNREAVRWMARDILPLVRKQRPGCRLNVVGSGGRTHLADLQQDGVIEITGSVPDLLPWYRRSRLAVVPLLSGGGTRLKILEAMALGRPVVSTTLGCEGIEARDGHDVLLADDPGAFASLVVKLLEDREMSSRLAREGRALVENAYDWDLLSSRLLEEYARLVEGKVQ